MNRRIAIGLLLLGLMGSVLPAFAAKTEDQLIQDLSSPNAGKVTDALLELEKKYPNSPKSVPEIKKLLTDQRVTVRRKAARGLGAVHAEVSDEDLKNIAALLKGTTPAEQIDGLKALRGLKAQKTVPEILPLLKASDSHVVRDACRTLAVLGNKETVSAIEPLTESSDSGIKKDAQDAIFQLKSK